ncbi:hypothetical protein [Actinoplanes sp. NPDC051851]|uniref:hypothetical protein n=1 Tax=Actinoplanes sp. NPDC051851 TaxID=3154753 RepID=UPI0034218AF4
MVVGPFQQFTVAGGTKADLYLLRYDENGRSRSPQTERQLKASLAGISDVFVFSHGWNSIFRNAVERYRNFITGYIDERRKFGVPIPDGYRPLLIGVIWPSTSFVMPWEEGPEIPVFAGVPGRDVEEMLSFVTAGLDRPANAELTELLDGRDALDRTEARRAAQILLAALRPEPDPDDGSPPPTLDEWLDAWSRMDPAPAGPGARRESLTAGDLQGLNPRDLLRAATVWKMKARAGKVGAAGLGPLARHVLANSSARLHLIGHSFGAKLVLSALAAGTVPRKAHSVLLLQAAVNRWCFAANVAGTGRAGGYQAVLDRVERPIMTTFSAHDEPLHDFFHLALRGRNLGEQGFAAFGDPDLYGALGGYGPSGLGPLALTDPAIAAGTQGYRLTGSHRVLALDGTGELAGHPAIGGHSDVSTPLTWWALHRLTTTA